MKILVTGASGFIGSFLCEEGLKRGMETWAGMRERSSKRWLTDERLHFATLDMTDKDTLHGQLEACKEQVGRWDVVIHAAGATKCLRREDFYLHNYECTKHLVNTLDELDMLPEQFLYVSSLSVLGPIRDQQKEDGSYDDMVATDEPRPNTAYGMSKVESERFLAEKRRETDGRFHYTIFRPTGVYGPREKDYFMMAKSIKGHIDFAVGYKRQVLTFVYVRDLVGAIFTAIGQREKADGKAYFISDGHNYPSRAFSDLIQQELGVKRVWHIKAPLWLLRTISAVAEAGSKLTGKPSTLNGDKYRIMCQRNWQCDISPLRDELGFMPEWPLERGVKECMDWYKENKWI